MQSSSWNPFKTIHATNDSNPFDWNNKIALLDSIRFNSNNNKKRRKNVTMNEFLITVYNFEFSNTIYCMLLSIQWNACLCIVFLNITVLLFYLLGFFLLFFEHELPTEWIHRNCVYNAICINRHKVSLIPSFFLSFFTVMAKRTRNI